MQLRKISNINDLSMFTREVYGGVNRIEEVEALVKAWSSPEYSAHGKEMSINNLIISWGSSGGFIDKKLVGHLVDLSSTEKSFMFIDLSEGVDIKFYGPMAQFLTLAYYDVALETIMNEIYIENIFAAV